MGRMALKHKFISKQQIREALEIQKRGKIRGKRLLFGEILVSHGMISSAQLDFLLSAQKIAKVRQLDRDFGWIAVKNGFAREEEIVKALEKQKQIFTEANTIKLIGDLLVESGTLTKVKRDAILLGQKRVKKSISDAKKKHELPQETEQLERDAEFELNISEDRLSAFIVPKADVPGLITIKSIKKFLEVNSITYGIVDDSVIYAYLKEENRQNKPWKIAEGKPIEPAMGVTIKYYFETDPLKVGTVDTGGAIDFKDKGEVPFVKEGELLAEKVDGVEGSQGVDVFGRSIPAPKPKDAKLRFGKGTTISEDKSKLFAAADGIPQLSVGGKVHVFSRLQISGDVDLKTGHVDFDGDIHVAGTIKSGFQIKGASLSANEILKSDIEIRGDISVSGGIRGAAIKSGGNIRAKYIDGSDIEASGSIAAEKEIVDSNIDTSGECLVKEGTVISSSITAKKGIWATRIGSESSNPCTLVVGVDVKAKNAIMKMKELIRAAKADLKKSETILKEFETELKHIEEKIGKAAQVQDKAMIHRRATSEKLDKYGSDIDITQRKKAQKEIADLDSTIEKSTIHLENLFNRQDQIPTEVSSIQQKTKDSEAEIDELEDSIIEIIERSTAEKGIPQVRVNGKVFQDTKIQGIYSSLTIPKDHKNVLIKELQIPTADDLLEWKIIISGFTPA